MSGGPAIIKAREHVPLLRAVGVGFTDTAGRQRLYDINVVVDAGQLWLVNAAPGSGKSLLLEVLYGLEKATSGTLQLFGKDVLRASHFDLVRLWREAGFVFQEGALISNLTLRGNIELPMRYRAEFGAAEAKRRADELIDYFHLGGHADVRPASVGLGIRKRAALARSLACRPRILFADDLFTGTGAMAERDMLAALNAARETWGMAVVVATGDMEPWRNESKRIIVLQGGTIAAQGSLEDMWHHPSPEIRALFE